MGWLRNIFCRTKTTKDPSVALSKNLYVSKELAGFSITKLDINKQTIFNELINDRDAQKIADFINSKL